MNETVLQPLRLFLEKQPAILFAYVFGSRVSGVPNSMSDLDVAIYADSPLSMDRLMNFQTEAAERMRLAALDLVDLRNAPPLLSYEIITSGKLLFTKDESASNRFEQKTLLHYLDTQHLRNVQNDYLRDHLRAS